MPIQRDGKTYYTLEEVDTHMNEFIGEQTGILKQELHDIRMKKGLKRTESEIVLL